MQLKQTANDAPGMEQARYLQATHPELQPGSPSYQSMKGDYPQPEDPFENLNLVAAGQLIKDSPAIVKSAYNLARKGVPFTIKVLKGTEGDMIGTTPEGFQVPIGKDTPNTPGNYMSVKDQGRIKNEIDSGSPYSDKLIDGIPGVAGTTGAATPAEEAENAMNLERNKKTMGVIGKTNAAKNALADDSFYNSAIDAMRRTGMYTEPISANEGFILQKTLGDISSVSNNDIRAEIHSVMSPDSGGMPTIEDIHNLKIDLLHSLEGHQYTPIVKDTIDGLDSIIGNHIISHKDANSSLIFNLWKTGSREFSDALDLRESRPRK